ncbi:threonine/serine ThrE exporter family protein [Roseobacter ponti]|uniref:Threonine/serine exporter family protein n=1 Tax=Roseobacter ponti TaxID=1891787 RepID=A0A858STN8_9RHOB|nr:threonine/serine exporter family protein [Roseobacter ponti]QJF50246.1 threonine/serine exporter family protein [Roseobacter ponti]
MTVDALNDENFEDGCQFIIKLGIAAHGYGPSTSRLETFLTRAADALGISGVYFSTPSSIEFAFSKEGQVWQKTHVVRLPLCDFNMARLSHTGELVEKLTAGEMTLSDASDRLDEIAALPNPWGRLSYGLSFVAVTVGVAGLLHANIMEIVASGILSLLVYVVFIAADRVGGRFAESLPFVSAFLAGACATAINLFVPELNPVLMTLSAIIILIPGFQVSVAIIEIIDSHVEAGMVRLMSGIVYLVKQFAGCWLGLASIGMFRASQPEFTVPTQFFVDDITVGFFVALLFVGVGIAYQTLMKDMLWVLLGCCLTFTAVVGSSTYLGVEYSTLIGAIVAGVFANTWVRLTNRPTSIVLVPSITVMVSGSIGFRGLVVAAAGHSDEGMTMFIQMFSIAASIAAGLLVSNTILRPKITL